MLRFCSIALLLSFILVGCNAFEREEQVENKDELASKTEQEALTQELLGAWKFDSSYWEMGNTERTTTPMFGGIIFEDEGKASIYRCYKTYWELREVWKYEMRDGVLFIKTKNDSLLKPYLTILDVTDSEMVAEDVKDEEKLVYKLHFFSRPEAYDTVPATENNSSIPSEDPVRTVPARGPILKFEGKLTMICPYGIECIEEEELLLSGAQVQLWKDNTLIKDFNTKDKATYQIEIPLEHATYSLRFDKDGYTTKFVEVNTVGIPLDEIGRGFWMTVDMSLFQYDENFSFLETSPIGKAKYDKTSGDLVWDLEYTENVAERIKKVTSE
jgi:hypothetical protein